MRPGDMKPGVFSIEIMDRNEVSLGKKCSNFLYGDILDKVLEGFGGVMEVMDIWWNEMSNEGEVVCLMNDWRVFRYYLRANEFAALSYDDRVREINHKCLIFEDMDDYGRWKESKGNREEEEKRKMVNKIKEEKMTAYGEKMNDALANFFNGDIDGLAKIMGKNSGKGSYLEAEA